MTETEKLVKDLRDKLMLYPANKTLTIFLHPEDLELLESAKNKNSQKIVYWDSDCLFQRKFLGHTVC